jgi:hypothetical protein
MWPEHTTPRQVAADFRAAALSSGRYDLMVSEYRYPLTIYIDGIPNVIQRHNDMWGFYQTFHSSMRHQGFDRMTARVTAQDMPRAGRFRVWTDWKAEGKGKTGIIASTICYCTVVGNRVMTDMIEFTKVALPMLQL